MLFELQNIPQIKNEPRRAWYKDGDIQLIVWFSDSNEIISFQLCYDKDFDEYTFIWHNERGFSHTIVDDERDIHSYGYPVLLPNYHCDIEELIHSFDEKAVEIDSQLAAFIHNKLTEYQKRNESL